MVTIPLLNRGAAALSASADGGARASTKGAGRAFATALLEAVGGDGAGRDDGCRPTFTGGSEADGDAAARLTVLGGVISDMCAAHAGTIRQGAEDPQADGVADAARQGDGKSEIDSQGIPVTPTPWASLAILPGAPPPVSSGSAGVSPNFAESIGDGSASGAAPIDGVQPDGGNAPNAATGLDIARGGGSPSAGSVPASAEAPSYPAQAPVMMPDVSTVTAHSGADTDLCPEPPGGLVALAGAGGAAGAPPRVEQETPLEVQPVRGAGLPGRRIGPPGEAEALSLRGSALPGRQVGPPDVPIGREELTMGLGLAGGEARGRRVGAAEESRRTGDVVGSVSAPRLSVAMDAAATANGATEGPRDAVLEETMGQVLENASRLGVPRNSHLRVQLKPASLGMVDLRLTLRDGVLALSIQVDSPRAHQLIEHGLPELRAALGHRGLEIGQVALSLSSPSDALAGSPSGGSLNGFDPNGHRAATGHRSEDRPYQHVDRQQAAEELEPRHTSGTIRGRHIIDCWV